MDIKRHSFNTRLKAASSDGGDGIVEAIVSVFGNIDSYKERVMPGAFAASLASGLPKGVWMHDWEEPIAKTLECRELQPGDPLLPPELKELGGLYVKAQFYQEIEDSWQAYLKIKNGLVDEYSIGYILKKYAVNDDTGVWDRLEIDLVEWCPVLRGANRATRTLNVKTVLGQASGLELDDHTEAVLDAADGLVKRWEQVAEKRKADGKTTESFVTRLRAAHEKLGACVAAAKALDADPAPEAKTASLEWEAITHAAKVREIRGI
jgi:hypothetical protein